MSDKHDIQNMIHEYDRTQDMIRHYDDIAIRFSGIIHSGVLIFVGLSFGILTNTNVMFIYLFPVVILFVILANTLTYYSFVRHRSISQLKIKRILELEKQIGHRQFSIVDEAFQTNSIEAFPIKLLVKIYVFGLPLTLSLTYLLILVLYVIDTL